MRKVNLSFGNINVPLIDDRQLGELKIVTLSNKNSDGIPQRYRHYPGHIPSLFFLHQSSVTSTDIVPINNDFRIILQIFFNLTYESPVPNEVSVQTK
jgi:hypothetical protein